MGNLRCHSCESENAGEKEIENRDRTGRQRCEISYTRERLALLSTSIKDIYHWFTEGFETKDLWEAQTLLNSLSASIERPTSKWGGLYLTSLSFQIVATPAR